MFQALNLKLGRVRSGPIIEGKKIIASVCGTHTDFDILYNDVIGKEELMKLQTLYLPNGDYKRGNS